MQEGDETLKVISENGAGILHKKSAKSHLFPISAVDTQLVRGDEEGREGCLIEHELTNVQLVHHRKSTVEQDSVMTASTYSVVWQYRLTSTRPRPSLQHGAVARSVWPFKIETVATPQRHFSALPTSQIRLVTEQKLQSLVEKSAL